MIRKASAQVAMPPEALQPAHKVDQKIQYDQLEKFSKSRTHSSVKRLLDVAGCLLILIAAFPLLVLIGILIRLDSPGPIIYSSNRLGAGGKCFPCFKFRTMHLDAEERLQSLLESDEHLRFEYEVFHKLKNDPRITRIGSILRSTSLDELPQLINVILGHMSLVGPRPYLVREAGKMVGFIDVILNVRPGLTGYWQVEGRNASTFLERLEMDLFYVNNRTLLLDLSILLKTIWVVVRKNGAY